ncbi:MAG: hypothetical protein A2Z18_01865 [Armatimonadetes bacterium RBG_16_58_9]|nr:MAG: hypothetical protein A2Z18_01865 [Armatimonadetes bacterium RBG_16_58_9]
MTLKAARGQYGLIALILLSVALGFSLALNFTGHRSGDAIAGPADLALMRDWQNGFVGIAEKLGPSVVQIISEKTVEARPMMPGFEDFFDFGPFNMPRMPRQQPEKQTQRASGSGVIVRSDGYILTNNHVVAGADRVDVKLIDGREFKGNVLLDPVTDLALVKIDASNLPAAQLADSDKVKVGQWAVAVGNPFGLRNTVTVGVVSAVRKEVDPEDPLPYAEVIQTDASINFGNSGGPLVDIEGRVIGINGAIYSSSGGNVGIGFAIPSNTAKYVMDQLIEKGKVIRGYLGVEMRDLTPTMAKKLGVTEGALVTNVSEGSAAEKGGIQVKDVVIRVSGKPVANGAQLRRAVESIAPGKSVEVVVVRDKKEKSLTLTLDERPTDLQAAAQGDGSKLGLSVKPLTEELARQIGVDPGTEGVVVYKVEPGSAANRANIQVNDVIMEIDDAPVTSVASFTKAVKDLKSGDTAIVVVQRKNRSVILELTLD